MKEIKVEPESLLQIMYGLLLPAIGGTIFWYLIQHISSGKVLEMVTCLVIVYYFGLHFLAGQQLDAEHYGKVGFALDFVAIVAIEVLFYAVDGLPENHELGMASILVILLTLTLWNSRTGRLQGLRVSMNHAALIGSMVLVGTVWAASYWIDVIDEHTGTLVSVVILAIASSAYLLVRTSRAKAVDEPSR